MNMNMEMKSLREVCELTGVSRRTLQEYASEKIDLLQPTAKTETGGYWQYDYAAIVKLFLIQLYVEAGYTRKNIKKQLENPDFDLPNELDGIINSLEEKIAQLEGKVFGLKIMKKMNAIANAAPKEQYAKAFIMQAKRMIDSGHSKTFNIPMNFKALSDLFVTLRTERLTESEKEFLSLFLDNLMYIYMLAFFSHLAPDSTTIQFYVKKLYDSYNNLILFICTHSEESSSEDSTTEEEIQELKDAIESNDSEYIEEFKSDALSLLDEELKKELDETYGNNFIDFFKAALMDFNPDKTG